MEGIKKQAGRLPISQPPVAKSSSGKIYINLAQILQKSQDNSQKLNHKILESGASPVVRNPSKPRRRTFLSIPPA